MATGKGDKDEDEIILGVYKRNKGKERTGPSFPKERLLDTTSQHGGHEWT